MTTKKLYRSTNDAKVCGICGGIAEYFNVDSTLVRIVAVITILSSQIVFGLIVYFIMAMIIPSKPQYNHADNDHRTQN